MTDPPRLLGLLRPSRSGASCSPTRRGRSSARSSERPTSIDSSPCVPLCSALAEGWLSSRVPCVVPLFLLLCYLPCFRSGSNGWRFGEDVFPILDVDLNVDLVNTIIY